MPLRMGGGGASGTSSGPSLPPASSYFAPSPPSTGGGGGGKAPRPFEALGKTAFNPFLAPPPIRKFDEQPEAPSTHAPAEGGLIQGEAFKGVPVLEQLSQIIGGIANVPAFALSLPDRITAGQAWADAPDLDRKQQYEQLVKSNTISQEQAEAQYRRDVVIAQQVRDKEHGLFKDLAVPSGDYSLGGQVLGAASGVLSIPQRVFTRATGGNLLDLPSAILGGGGPQAQRLRSLAGATDDQLNYGGGDTGHPELIALRDALNKGELTPDEAFDELIITGFGTTNPVDGLPMIFQMFTSDPSILLGGGAGVLTRVSARAVETGMLAVTKEIGAEGITALRGRLAEAGVQSVKANGSNILLRGLRDTTARPLIEAALKDINPAQRFLIVDAPGVIRAANVIQRIVDPFSFFGGDHAGQITSQVFNKKAAWGITNGFGAENVRKMTALISTELGDDVAGVFDEHFARAGAQIVASVGNAENITAHRITRALDSVGSDTTDAAMRAAKRSGSEIGQLAQALTERTRWRLPVLAKGGTGDAMARAREQAILQVKNIAGVEEDVARRVVGKMDEGMLSILDSQHYGKAGKDLLDARAAAVESGIMALADRAALIGPRQLTKPGMKALKKAIKKDDITAVRGMIEKYDDLYRLFGDSVLSDDELLKRISTPILKQIEAHLPESLEDLSKVDSSLALWAEKYKQMGYRLGLRPADEDLARPIYDAENNVIGINPWVDFIDEKVAQVTVSRMKVIQQALFSNISGASVLRDAEFRFVRLGAEKYGLPAVTMEGMFKRIMYFAREEEVTTRALTIEQMYKAAMGATPPKALASRMSKRQLAEMVMTAHEGSLGKVGLTQKFTGRAKSGLLSFMGNTGVAQLAGRYYPNMKFKYNPFFQMQEMLETPFFMLLRGRLPFEDLKRVWSSSGRAEMALELEQTLFVLKKLESATDNIAEDMGERSMLSLLGNRAINQELRKGKMAHLGRGIADVINVKRMKDWGYVRQFQWEMKNNLRKAMNDASPQSWDNYATWMAYRAGREDASELRAITAFMYDTMAKSDPDSAYAKFGDKAFLPHHLGPTARISPELIKSFALGADAGSKAKWRTYLKDVREGRQSVSRVHDALEGLQADPVYIKRATDMLSAPDPDEFYESLITLGRARSEVDTIRGLGQMFAKMKGISEHEALSRAWSGGPLNIDGKGEVLPGTYYQQLTESLTKRGMEVLESDDPRMVAVTPSSWLDMSLPDDWESKTIAELTSAQRKAREWQVTATRIEGDPDFGRAMDPSRPVQVSAGEGKAIQSLYDQSDEAFDAGRFDEAQNLVEQAQDLQRGAGKGGEAGIRVADGTTLDEIRASMGLNEFDVRDASRPDLYMTHPKSGYRVRNEVPAPQVFAGPDGRPMLRDVKPDRFRMRDDVPIEGTERPLTHVFRAISEEDWEAIKARGSIQSDGRMNISMDEGTVTSSQDPSYYLPGRNQASAPLGDHPGRIIRIRVDAADGWQMNKSDSYIKTNTSIPIDRVEMVSPKIVTNKADIPSRLTGTPITHVTERVERGGMPAEFSTITKNGVVHRLGEPTGDQWWEMVENGMSEQQIAESLDWYGVMRRSVMALSGNDPEEARKLLLLFGMSQLNTSPEKGLLNVFQSLSKYAREGKLPVNKSLSGLNAERLVALIQDGTINDAGLGQKLIDFVDSLLNKRERTAGYAGPDIDNPWGPVAGDIWAKRDLGYLDPKMSGHLGHLYGGKAVWDKEVGFRVTTGDGRTFVIPKEHVTGGVPSNAEYHQIVRFYNERAREANARNVGGRANWTAADMQALGWFRSKLAMGDNTGRPSDALMNNSWNVSHDIAPTPHAQIADLYPGGQGPTHILSEAGDLRGRITHPEDVAALRARGDELSAAINDLPRQAVHHLNGQGAQKRGVIVRDLHAKAKKVHGGTTYDPRTGAVLKSDEVFHGTPVTGSIREIGITRGHWTDVPRIAEMNTMGSRRGGLYRTRPGELGERAPRPDNIIEGGWVRPNKLNVLTPSGEFAPLDEAGDALGGPYVSAIAETVSVPVGASSADFRTAFDKFAADNESLLTREGTYIGVFHNAETGQIDIDVNLLVDSHRDAEALQASYGRTGGAYDFWSGNGVFAPVEGRIENGLEIEVAAAVNEDLGRFATVQAEELVGTRTLPGFNGVGTWEGPLNANYVSEVIGNARDVQAHARVMAYLSQRESAPMSRLAKPTSKANPDNGFYHAMEWSLDADTGSTYEQAAEALRRLTQRDPLVRKGATVVRYGDGSYGVRAVWRDGKVPEGKVSVPTKDFKAAYPDERIVEVKGGVTMTPRRVVVEYNAVTGDHLAWLKENGYESVAGQLAGPTRQRMAVARERIFQKHAAGGTNQYRTKRALDDPGAEDRGAAYLDAIGPDLERTAANDATAAGSADDAERGRLAARAGTTYFQRYPKGTLGAIAFDALDQRARLSLSAKSGRLDTLLHELSHHFAEHGLDPSGRSAVLDTFNAARGRLKPPRTSPTKPQREAHARGVAEYNAALDEYHRLMKAHDAAEKAAKEPPPPVFDAQAPGNLGKKWRDRETKNRLGMERDLRALEKQGWDIRSAEDELGNYDGIERSDFSDYEEYAEERQTAWDAVLDEIDLIERADGAPIDAPPPVTEPDPLPPGPRPIPPTPPAPLAKGVPGAMPIATTTWTEDVHEWFAQQMVEYVRTGDSPAPHITPLFDFYKKYLTEVTHKVKVSPEMKSILDEALAKKPGRVSASDPSHDALMSVMVGESHRAARNARDLTFFKTNRSWAERSLNHPYFGMYPASYMWGKVLPELMSFLLARPFGVPAPFAAYNAVGMLYRQIMQQQASDPDLKKYMADNEPAFRAIAMYLPGIPWDIPVNSPLWFRRIAEAVATQQQRVLSGELNPDGSDPSLDLTKIDYGKILEDTGNYALNPMRAAGSIVDSAVGTLDAAALIKNRVLNEPIPGSEADLRTQEAAALTTEQPGTPEPQATTPVPSPLEVTLQQTASDLTNAISP